MASYYNYAHTHPTPAPAHNGHGRNRRAPRLSVSQNSQRQFRGVRSMKELGESSSLANFRMKFEAVRSFDLEDDMEFCPNLLTDNDVSHQQEDLSSWEHVLTQAASQISSISSASERSSLASNSPQSSPTQQPQTVPPGFSLNSSSPPFIPPASFHTQQSNHKMAQVAATTRGRNAIPIINPATGITMSSPPPSVSPAKMQQSMGRRW
jgi:hypothetical protein